jgi:hypothetical protein
MKGVILSLDRTATIVDITHAVAPFDVLDGALTLAHTYSWFPSGTIHVVVVDPGVGGERRPLVAECAQYRFIAPDNGVLSLVMEREPRMIVRHANRSRFFRAQVGATFHGRDVFAPLAGHMARGVPASELGETIKDPVRLNLPAPQAVEPNLTRGSVLRVDRFGNLVTNLRPESVPELFGSPTPRFALTLGQHAITALRATFSAGAPGEIFLLLGSMGYLEIVANQGSAAALLGEGRGSPFELRLFP